MELVSMIIPVYGVEVYLGECLETVLNQTYENLEIILIISGEVGLSNLLLLCRLL